MIDSVETKDIKLLRQNITVTPDSRDQRSYTIFIKSNILQWTGTYLEHFKPYYVYFAYSLFIV